MKKILKIIALVLVLAMLAACGGSGGTGDSGSAGSGDSGSAGSGDSGDSGSSGGSADAGDKTVVTVWSNNRHDEVYMNEMVEKFNNISDTVYIDYVIMTDDWANSIQLAFQANTAPDVITIAASDGMTLQNYVDANMFEPLNTYIDGDADLQSVTEAYDHM